MEGNLTSGSVMKNIARFSVPYLVSYLLQTLYGMADLFIIGQFDGVAATTAVSVGSQVMHMVTVIMVGLAMGTTVTIAQAVGANDREMAAKGIGNTIVLFLGVSLAATALLLALVRPIVGVMSTPEEAVEGTVSYLTICFFGIPFITAYNILSAIFRGLGDTKSPMIFIAVACAANIALDYLFIGAFGLGPAGAALGTTLAQTISVAIALFAIRRRNRSRPDHGLRPRSGYAASNLQFDTASRPEGLPRGITLKGSDLRPQRDVMRKILKIGVPIAFQDGLMQVAFLTITAIANMRGLNDAAAVGIVEKFICFVFLVPSTMQAVVSALGAQNIGAQKPERADATLRCALGIAVGFGIFAAVTVQFIANPIVALFTDSAEVIELGGQYLRGYIIDCIFAGIHFSCSGYFCAIGKSWISFVHNLCSIALVRIPAVYVVSQLFPDTLLPMGLATTSGSLVSVIICAVALALLRREGASPTSRVNPED